MAIKRKLEFQEKNRANEYGDGVAWLRGPILGKGSFGSVYKATLKKPTSQLPAEMAVKSAEVSVSTTLRHEKEIMSRLNWSDYIIKCFGDETTFGDNGVMAYNLLLEYGSDGTLAAWLKKQWRLPEDEVRAHTRSLLMGLCHVHVIGYVHCDLKPENTLLLPDEGGGFTAKIGDFGLSKKMSNDKKRKLTAGERHWRGTPMYLSPECVNGFAQEAPSDVWALGCIVLEMLTGKRPWEGETGEILARIGAENEIPKIPDSISENARDFLMCCLERDPRCRVPAEVLLDHPFVDCWHDFGDDNNVEELEDYYESDETNKDDEFTCDPCWFPDDWMLSSCKQADPSTEEEGFVGSIATSHYPDDRMLSSCKQADPSTGEEGFVGSIATSHYPVAAYNMATI